MDIIEKICKKYKIEYNLMPERGMRPIRLSFGPEIPQALRLEVEDALARLSIFPESMGMEAQLLAVPGRQDALDLNINGRRIFRLTNSTCRVTMLQTPLSETAAWTIAVAASHPEWLEHYGYQGFNLVCGCFCARQQAAALRLKQSVEEQYVNSVPSEAVRTVYEKLKSLIAPYIYRVPRFSARPISQDRYSGSQGGPLDGSLGQIAQHLYGDEDFQEELEDYCAMVCRSTGYRDSLEEGIGAVMDQVYELPIMAISNFFSGLRTCADERKCCSDAELRHLKQNKASFQLTADNLARSFQDLDKAYISIAAGRLLTEFIYEVCEQCEHRVHQEYGDCRRKLMQLSAAVNRFCYIRKGCFGKQNEQGETLGWKSLSDLQERDIFSRDLSWDKESFGTLMNEAISAQGPAMYLCSRDLADQMVDPMVHGVPLMDSRLAWIFWVDHDREEAGL